MFEKGWELQSGKQMVLPGDASRLQALGDILLYLVLLKGTSWSMAKLKGWAAGPHPTVPGGTVLRSPKGGTVEIAPGHRPTAAELESAIEAANAGKTVRLAPPPFNKPWSAMTEAERRAFQHAYSRHAKDFGLQQWSEANAEALRTQYNQAAARIKRDAQTVRTDRWPVGEKGSGQAGEWKEVRIYEFTDSSGKKFYYAETLDGKFVSAGEVTK